jgi:MFS family permease
MFLVQCLRVAIIGALATAALFDLLSLPILYVAAFALGVGETLFDTAAQSIMPSIVGKDQLSKANGRLYAAEITANQFAGPPLGGLMVGISVALALGSSAIGYFAAAIGLALVQGSFRPERTGASTRMHQEILEGLRYLWRNRLLRTLAAMVGVANMAATATFAVLPLYAVSGPMRLSEPAFGLLLITSAGGSVLGSLIVDRVERRIGRANLLALGVVGTGAALAIPAVTTSPLLVGAGFFVSGVGIMMWNVVTVSLRQRIVPDRLLGRLNSSYRLLAWGTQPLGALLGGLLGELFGLRAVFAVSGLAVALLLVARLTVTDDAIRAAESATESEATRGGEAEAVGTG